MSKESMKQALKQAYKALEDARLHIFLGDEIGVEANIRASHACEGLWQAIKIAEAEQAWVGLTDEEIEMIVENRRAAHWEFIRQVESILKKKNT